YQKLVEEAPAPFLTEEQRASLYDASKKICLEAGYVGAGTVEFLVAEDGLISFLEVNTRLQVEHPVTEEVTGIDLVRWQFRIADGEPLMLEDPPQRGHAFEFRINGEDPGRNFLPAPGTVTTFDVPLGPGVRVDTGVQAGDVIGGQFDSLLAKLIVFGSSRQEALERSRRALDELTVEGMATALPFHRAVVRDIAFAPDDVDAPFTIHNKWIENEFDNQIPAFTGGTDADTEQAARETVVVEVGGKRLEVVLPEGFGAATATPAAGGGGKKRKRTPSGAGSTAAGGDALTSPMQGTIVKVTVSDGDTVEAGDPVVVLEAMKMEQPLNAHKAGTITGLTATVGGTVTSGGVICEIKD
ncbi:MAG: acetyl-CoA/propionyl-CoA carboxylase, biotin carboxylase, biotin carboxyl carrier protein, partial [Frankiaceae bacterium]|nr:acetyl-CoA/propionyl-CoA carboxylase, biotin carboxylase, biotin carboxyl carrier protein [Frankiaceae bacterium]